MSLNLGLQIWQWLNVEVPTQALSPAPIPTDKPTTDLALLSHLFGSSEHTHQDNLADSTQRLTLLASFVSPDPERSSAIILNERGISQRVLVNHAVNSRTRLHQVANDHIVLLHNGIEERLSFPKPQPLLSASVSSAAGQIITDPQPAPDPLSSLDLDDENVKALQQRIQQLQSRLKPDHVMRSSTFTEVDH